MSFLDYSWITTFLVFVLTYLLVLYATRKPQGIPPGPPVLPVLGNLVSFAGDVLQNLERLKVKFGDIYSLYLGNELVIFLSGYDAIHDALVKKGSMFTQRPQNEYDRLVVKHPGIGFSNGNLWKEQRKFATAALNELCFKNGGGNVEEIVKREASHLVKKLGDLKYPTDIDLFLMISFSNVIFYIAYKHRFDYDDDRVHRYLSSMREMADGFTKLHTLVNCFPFLSKLPFDALGIKRTHSTLDKALGILRPFVNGLKTNHTKEKRDTLVDLYVNDIEEKNKSGDFHTSTEDQLEITILDLLAAGSETSATTVQWLLIYLIRYPFIQDKVFDEINSILGKESPYLSDRKRLPYTQAVILEVLRISPVVPLAIPHTVTEDKSFHGYLLPKDCTIMANINSAHNDPRVWKKPEEFRPERFLSNDETELDIPKQFIPFSLGQRSCFGETLARIELFLFVTTLVQNFKFLPANDGEMPSLQGRLGVTWTPTPYKIKLVKRDLM